MNVPVTGIMHAGPRLANKEERRRQNAVGRAQQSGGGLRCRIEVSNSPPLQIPTGPGAAAFPAWLLKGIPWGRAPAEVRNHREMRARNPGSRKTACNPSRGSRRARFRGPPPAPGSGFRETSPAPMTAPRTDSRARRSGFGSTAGAAVPGLISACRAWTTAMGRWRGRPGPKKRGMTSVCAVEGVAQGRLPPRRFTRDSCRYRA